MHTPRGVIETPRDPPRDPPEPVDSMHRFPPIEIDPFLNTNCLPIKQTSMQNGYRKGCILCVHDCVDSMHGFSPIESVQKPTPLLNPDPSQTTPKQG